MRFSYLRTLLFLLPVLLLLSCSQAHSNYESAIEAEISTGVSPYAPTGISLTQPETGTPESIHNSLEVPEADPSGDYLPSHLALALSYEGVTEATGNNDGPQIEQFLEAVNLSAGTPYCAAFVSFVLDSSRVDRPQIRSALAYDYITDRSIEARKVLRGTEYVPPGTILVWRKGNTIYGHAGFAVAWDGPGGATIEANTSPGDYKSQADGDGVWRRKRTIMPASYFRITHFTPVSYPHA